MDYFQRDLDRTNILVKVIKQGKTLKPSWLSVKNVKKARRARKKAWKTLKHQGLHIDQVNYDSVKSENREELRNAKAKYEDDFVDAIPSNPKRFITTLCHLYQVHLQLTHLCWKGQRFTMTRLKLKH